MQYCMVSLLSLVWLFQQATPFCFTDDSVQEIVVSGETQRFCPYQDIFLTVGSRLRTADCLECECHDGGLVCCGFGINAGPAAVQGCHAVEDGCDVIYVRDNDTSLECFSGQPLQQVYPNKK